MSIVIGLMAAALAQELRARDIAALGEPICLEITEAVVKKTAEAAARLVDHIQKRGDWIVSAIVFDYAGIRSRMLGDLKAQPQPKNGLCPKCDDAGWVYSGPIRGFTVCNICLNPKFRVAPSTGQA